MDDYSNQIMQGGAMVSSGLSSLGNQIGQSKENEKAREYNSAEAQKSRDYNSWLLSNQSQLKARDARSAGLNPAFMNGAVLSSSPSVGSSPSSPNTFQPFDPSVALSNELLRAQIGNVEAMTDKVYSETQRNDIQNKYLDELMQKKVNLVGSNIDLNLSNSNLSKAKAQEVAQSIAESEQRIAKIVGELNIMRKQAEILTHEERIKAIEEAFKHDEMQAIIDNYRASAHLSMTQANDIVRSFAYRMYGIVSQAELNEASTNKVYWDGESSRLHFNLDEDYGEAERVVGLVNGSVDALQGVSNLVFQYLPAGKAAKLAGGVKFVKHIE